MNLRFIIALGAVSSSEPDLSTSSITDKPGLLEPNPYPGQLPIMYALSHGTQYTDTTAYIYDSVDQQVNFDDWFLRKWPDYIPGGTNETETLDQMKDLTDAWKVSIDMNCNISDEDSLNKLVYNDTSLIVPLGGSKILWSWLLLQSLLDSSVSPKTVILVTGLNPEIDEPHKFRTLHEYILRYFKPYLPNEVDIKWAVFDGPGNAGISRAIGGRLANTTYVMYHDADDVLGHSAIEHKISVLRKYSDIDQVLGSYTGCESSSEHIDHVGEFLKSEITSVDRPVNKLLALDDLSLAYCKTVYDVPPLLEFNKDDAVKEVTQSYSYKENISLKDVTNWPQLRWFRDCTAQLKAIKQAEAKATNLTDQQKEDEQKSYQWFKDSCGNSNLEPQYVGGCHNGWGAIRTQVFNKLPLVYPFFGEDSMLTFMVSHSNHTSVCLKNATGGVYVLYRRDKAKIISHEIFPRTV